MKPKWKNIATVIGTEAIESSADGVFLNETQMDAIADRLDATNPEFETLQTAQSDLATANENLATANANLETATNQLNEANAQNLTHTNRITELENQLATANQSITDLNAKLVNRVDDTTIHTTGNEGGGNPEKYTWTKNHKS